MPRKYIPKTPEEKAEGRARQMHAHKHNGLTGYVAMMQRQLMEMRRADSTCHETKAIANEMLNLSVKLKESLKTRID